MEHKETIADKLAQLRPVPYDKLPDIELYMDQVLECLSYSHLSLISDEKLTSAMVNNYIKAGLLPRAAGKKYSKKHLVYLTVIARLKQVLSVKSTGELLSATMVETYDEAYYDAFCDMVSRAAEEVARELRGSEEALPEIAMRLAVDSYVKKVASEYIIDIITEKPAEKPKTKNKPGKSENSPQKT